MIVAHIVLILIGVGNILFPGRWRSISMDTAKSDRERAFWERSGNGVFVAIGLIIIALDVALWFIPITPRGRSPVLPQ